MIPKNNNTVIVRYLRPEDASELLALRLQALDLSREAFGSSYLEEFGTTQDDISSMLGGDQNESFMLGAFKKGQLIGMVGVIRSQGIRFRHKADMWGLYVSPDWRKHGVGRLLLDEVLIRARTMTGVRALKLSVNADQPPAIKLYSSAGFHVNGIEREALYVHGKYHVGVHMELRLV